MNIPEFETIGGQFYPDTSTGYGDIQQTIINTVIEEVYTYAENLTQYGYKLHSKSQVPAGSFNPYPNNLFFAFEGRENNLFLSFNPSAHVTKIIATPKTDLPSTEIANDKKIVTPSFTQYPVTQGMCYIIQLANGNFIMVDGGTYYENDMQGIYDFLKSKSLTDIPVIENWFFTHPDYDHIELATHFIKDYLGQVEILAFTYQFCNVDIISSRQVATYERGRKDIVALENAISLRKNAKIYTPHRGQTFYYNGLNIVMLWTCEDLYPYPLNNFNQTSLAFKINFDSGKTALIMGDCMHESCKEIALAYREYLKCDWLQVTHHGVIGGDKGLYTLADPDICFWPVTKQGFEGTFSWEKYHWCLGEGGCDYNAFLRDDSIKIRTHYTNEKIITLIAD